VFYHRPMKTPKSKNQDIQVLRAIAILLVVMQHYRNRLPTPDAYGKMFDYVQYWSGVDIFFAISGFLIYRSFAHQTSIANSKSEALRGFWSHRFLRLYPASLFWVAISIGVAAAVHIPFASASKALLSGAAALVGVSNIYWSACIPNFSLCGNPDVNGITWSLSLEWQLYATLSTLMIVMGGKRAVAVLLVAAAVVSALDAPLWSLPWALRFQSFALGALLSYLISERLLTRSFLSTATSRVALVAGILVTILAPLHVPQPMTLPVIALGSLLCLASSMKGDSYSGHRWSAPFEWIGERSYSIYLCHLPVILVVREFLARTSHSEPTAGNVIAALVATVVLVGVLSDLSYRFIETPFQRFHKPTAANQRSGDGSAVQEDGLQPR
jgi:peptidoglycan/LPS O-acetylase OafA/YrhL